MLIVKNQRLSDHSDPKPSEASGTKLPWLDQGRKVLLMGAVPETEPGKAALWLQVCPMPSHSE